MLDFIVHFQPTQNDEWDEWNEASEWGAAWEVLSKLLIRRIAVWPIRVVLFVPYSCLFWFLLQQDEDEDDVDLACDLNRKRAVRLRMFWPTVV